MRASAAREDQCSLPRYSFMPTAALLSVIYDYCFGL